MRTHNYDVTGEFQLSIFIVCSVLRMIIIFMKRQVVTDHLIGAR